MNKKSVYLSMRLNRIAPQRDRAYIAASTALTVLCGCAAVVSCLLAALANLKSAACAVVFAGLAAQAVSLFLIIKETVRNRFFSAVLLLFFSLITIAALIFAAVYVLG